MKHLQCCSRLAFLALATAGFALPSHVHADENSDRLQEGILLFEEGDYLAAQETLLKIDRDALNQAEQSLRDEYVERVQIAVTMVEKATSDLEQADAALEQGDLSQAETFYAAIISNDFAPRNLKQAAADGMEEVARQRRDSAEVHREVEESTPSPEAPAGVREAEPSTVESVTIETREEAQTSPTDEARRLVREAETAMAAGDDARAEDLYLQALGQVAGYPEAVEGLREIEQRRRFEGSSTNLLQRLQERDRVNWQRTVANFRDAAADVRDNVMAERFGLARQALLRARQVLESGRQFADPITKYEALLAELNALERYVEEEEVRFNEAAVRDIREETLRQEEARRQEIEASRAEQIDRLVEEATLLRKDGDYEGAIELLEQVVALDPSNTQVRSMLDAFYDNLELRRQRDIWNTRERETQKIMGDLEASKIPWQDELRYPDNWLELINRSDTRTASGLERLSPEDLSLKAKLDSRYAATFDGVPFENVMDRMADDLAINMNVIWSDLETSGIKRDLPVKLMLADPIPFRRALREVLDVVGGSNVDLGFNARNGVVKVATRSFLDREVFTQAYDITDLLRPVQNFTDGPNIDGTQPKSGGRVADHHPISYATAQAYGDDDDEEEYTERDVERNERVSEILALIRNNVAFESWRENGGQRASIDEFNGQLVVTQTASAHQEIRDLLGQLREQAAIQVMVEAIFLQINSNYLEELGIDLDVVLNQGNAGYDQLGAVNSVTQSQLLLPRSFSRLGFTPATPAVGVPNVGTGLSATPGVPVQPYSNPALVPQGGNGLVNSSRATPIPFVSNFLDLAAPQGTDIEGSFGGEDLAPGLNIFGSFLDGIQVDFLVRATQADRRSSVLSAPRITMTNGQRSWIGVVTQEAFVSTLQPVLDENAAAVQPIIGLIETGVVLDVESTVSADKHYVTMTLRPGVGRLIGDIPVFEFGLAAGAAGSAGFIQTPTVQRQILKTTVTVPDGGTLLFGGLKLAAEVEVDAGVPILSKIPVLKRLYSARSMVKDESVLMILVKPKIIIQREAEERAFPTLAGR